MSRRKFSLPHRLAENPTPDLQVPRAFLGAILGLFALLGQLAGCASISAVTPKERAAIGAGDKALVLVSVRCTVDGQPFEPCLFRRDGSPLSDHLFVDFALGNFATFGEPVPATYRALSEGSFDAGWTCFILPPGIHYLAVLGPDSGITARRGASADYEKDLRDAPRWRIDVPEGAGLIYAGTLHLAGKVQGTLLFGDKIIKPAGSTEADPSDDRELAGRLLAEHFPDSGEVRTILMKRWHPGEPIILRSPLPGPNK